MPRYLTRTCSFPVLKLRITVQTGSGKTAAFLLPILHRLIEEDADSGAGPQCIVVTPTRLLHLKLFLYVFFSMFAFRELAIQIHNEARKFAQGSMMKSVVAYGGTSVFYQASQLQRGCNILVATPGRCYHDIFRICFVKSAYFVAVG